MKRKRQPRQIIFLNPKARHFDTRFKGTIEEGLFVCTYLSRVQDVIRHLQVSRKECWVVCHWTTAELQYWLIHLNDNGFSQENVILLYEAMNEPEDAHFRCLEGYSVIHQDDFLDYLHGNLA